MQPTSKHSCIQQCRASLFYVESFLSMNKCNFNPAATNDTTEKCQKLKRWQESSCETALDVDDVDVFVRWDTRSQDNSCQRKTATGFGARRLLVRQLEPKWIQRQAYPSAPTLTLSKVNVVYCFEKIHHPTNLP